MIKTADEIPVNPLIPCELVNPLVKTYDDAAKSSMCALVGTRVVVPPIVFTDEVMMRANMGSTVSTPIMPSQLQPFLSDDIVAKFGTSATERGRVFELPMMYAIYARYLLAWWKKARSVSAARTATAGSGQGGDCSTQWVAFTDVFAGAYNADQQSVVEGYELNLSLGVITDPKGTTYGDAVANGITFLASNYHHDAYLWCRTAVGKKEHPLALQLRHGEAKEAGALEKQLMRTSKGCEKVEGFLISVNQKRNACIRGHEADIVMINADAMSTIGWLWLIHAESEKSSSPHQ